MGSILCIDTDKIGRDNKLQKNLKLGNILVENTDYFSDFEGVDKKWRPLKFATTVRSIHSNKIICQDVPKENRTIYYHTYGSVDRFIHKGYDLVMFLSSMSIMEMLSDSADKAELNDVMFGHSIFKCQGIYFNAEIVDPVVFSIVYIEDDAFDSFFTPIALKDNWRVEDIAKMKEDSHGNIQALIEDIVLVEKGDIK